MSETFEPIILENAFPGNEHELIPASEWQPRSPPP